MIPAPGTGCVDCHVAGHFCQATHYPPGTRAGLCDGCGKDEPCNYEKRRTAAKTPPPIAAVTPVVVVPPKALALQAPAPRKEEVMENCYCGRPKGHTGRHVGSSSAKKTPHQRVVESMAQPKEVALVRHKPVLTDSAYGAVLAEIDAKIAQFTETREMLRRLQEGV